MKIPFLNYELRSTKKPRPEDWDDFWYSKQPYDNSTGIDVNEDVALTYSAVWACVKVISEDLASLPLFLYRRNGKSKERYEDHPLYYLLHDAPNPEMSALSFRESMQAHLLTWGNAYAEIQRNMRGQPMAMWPLNPGQMEVIRPAQELVYKYTIPGESPRYFSKQDVFHVAGMGYNGIIGYSPIGYQREAIGVGLAAQEWQGSNLKNGGRLQLAFVHPAERAPNQEGRDAFAKKIREEYGGRKGQSIAVLWEGMKPEKIGMTMEDAQFIESRKFNRSEICAIYRVPPHKIMDLERATFSNIEEQSISYVIDAIRPWAVRWEQAINQQLLNGSGMFFAEHSIDALLRGDIGSRYNAYAIGRQWGWLSVNDIRSLENMNPVAEGDGYMQPMNMIELGAKPEPEPVAQDSPITDEEKEQAARALRRLRLIRG